MCYLVAKRFKQSGSIVLKTKKGRDLSNFSYHLYKELGKDIHLITLSRPSAYGEYAPFTYVHSYEEFEKAAKAL